MTIHIVRNRSLWKSDAPSRHDRAKGQYVRRKPRKCAHCQEPYLPPYGSRARASNRYCGRRCYYAAVGQRPALVEATCVQCGAKFRRTAAAIKRVKHAFCGNECRIAFHVGENAPMFRGDKDPNRGAKWNRLADSIRQRDSYSCRRCGRCQNGNGRNGEKLSVDHVRPWRAFADKELANHPDNLVSLCRSCHSYKTSKVERAWLSGDVVTFKQWVKSLHLPSEARSFISREEIAVRQVRLD